LDLIEVTAGRVVRHPWEQARAAFFLRQLRAGLSGRPVRALDIGCGDAWFAGRLADRLPAGSTVTGWDIGFDPATMATLQARLPGSVGLTATEPTGRFDLLVAMDVIEHVADDGSLVKHLVEERLEPGGLVLCSVPAWPGLFSQHDVTLRHYRRYTPRMGLDVLRSAGLKVVRHGGLFHGLALVRAIQVARSGRAEPCVGAAPTPPPAEPIGLSAWQHGAMLTALVTWALEAEGLVSDGAARLGLGLPGLTWWALCQAA
jgi:SAM-dependent methyltransferase